MTDRKRSPQVAHAIRGHCGRPHHKPAEWTPHDDAAEEYLLSDVYAPIVYAKDVPRGVKANEAKTDTPTHTWRGEENGA